LSDLAKLYRVILPVNDIEAAAQFYGDVFQAPGKRVSPGRHALTPRHRIDSRINLGATGPDPAQHRVQV
jgi:predicted enzyme related to lactoylglutathione lyase